MAFTTRTRSYGDQCIERACFRENFWFWHAAPHGQNAGSHSTSTSLLMHSGPHPSPVSGFTSHVHIRTSSSVTHFGSRCVKTFLWMRCHTLALGPPLVACAGEAIGQSNVLPVKRTL